jgi:hypothetical protein
MLLMRRIEDPARPVGKLVSTKLTLGLDHFALAMTQLGSMALSHGLCMGRRQLTILTPPALFLTWRVYLWDLISPLDSRPFQPLGAAFGQQGTELDVLYYRADGQISFRMQFGQSGLRALHVRRPCKIRRWEKIVQSLSGTNLMSSCSTFTGSLLSVSPSLPETRRTWVSTTMPSFEPKALPRTTLAVLRPTPGRATSSDIVRGTSPPCSSTRALAMPRKERALLR